MLSGKACGSVGGQSISLRKLCLNGDKKDELGEKIEEGAGKQLVGTVRASWDESGSLGRSFH